MNYLSAENISKSFGEQQLFEGLSFGLSRGDKTALIARNGTGKTTLLRILMGREESDTGEFTLRNGIKAAFLEQSPELDETVNIEELIRSANTPVLTIIQNYKQALEKHSNNASDNSRLEMDHATSEMDRVQGWDYERRLNQLLDLFRITDTSQHIATLSGGEKKRLALALVLLDEPEILILDEPTNHLDIDMIEWLERYLSQTKLTLLMVTHDRYFLDRVCNRIMEMDQGVLHHYKGNYAYFLEKRAERMELQQAEKSKANQLMKKELEWLRRMPKARTGKSKSRIDAFEGIREKATEVYDSGELVLGVKMPRLGGKILEIDNLSKSYGSTNIVSDFTYKFSKGDRVGIIGRNGSGKTTFLNIISGLEKMDKGKMDVGATLVMAYYRQMGIQWDKNQRVIDAVKEIAEVVHMAGGKTVSASYFLEQFMFTPEAQYKMIEKLSGGELRRLHLLTVLIKNPNFLVLDEPTNDLDLFALNKLEEFLLAYKGCLVIVSHDRYFLDKLTDHLFIFEGEGKIRDHYGTYSAYKLQSSISKQGEGEIGKTVRAKPPEAKSQKRASTKDPGVKEKLSYRERQEYERLEPVIEALENEKTELEEELNAGNLEYELLHQKSLRVSELIQLIDQKMQRWMELGQYL
ncbi:ABC-F family ATP-binding cassette domain-containing protein [Bacteroidota bacterium]